MPEVKRIILAPGHGAKDPGACGNGLVEKYIAWNLCNEIINILRDTFVVEVILDQPSRTNPNLTGKQELNQSIDTANKLHKEKKIDFYMSIHVNAGGGEGFESHVYIKPSAESVRVTSIIHNQMMALLNKYNIKNRGVKYSNFAELRETLMPSGLFENLFIDSKSDAQLLADENFINKLANEYAYALSIALNLPRK